jgi:hypothetical protein
MANTNQIGNVGGFPNPYSLGSSAFNIEGGSMGNSTVPVGLSGVIQNTSVIGTPLIIFVGMIVLLLIFKFISEHKDGDLLGDDVAHLHIGTYNFLAVGVNATIFLVALKVLTAKYQIPGLSQFAAFA